MWLLMKKWNIYLFITRTRKHSKKKCYEANCKLFVKNSFHARWKIFGWPLFCAKTCLYSCSWTLSVRTVEQIMTSICAYFRAKYKPLFIYLDSWLFRTVEQPVKPVGCPFYASLPALFRSASRKNNHGYHTPNFL